MRLHIVSDLHVEFGNFILPKVEADVTIIAGDVAPGRVGLEWICENVPKDRPALYVLGNHEFYGHHLPELTEQLRKLARGTNISILENELIEIGGVIFLGATLWTDYALEGDGMGKTAFYGMADLSEINMEGGRKTLTPEFILNLHHRSRDWILKTGGAISSPKVIVTHHAHHPRSISPQYIGSRLNPAFASDLTSVIEAADAKFWIHGHIHSNSDYRVGRTRVINNPRGYVDENANGFNPNLVLEI
jgi:Icc-related predicted phosphoesterase